MEENVNKYLNGTYTMDETFEALRKKGKKSDKEIDSMLQLANEVQYSILTKKLVPGTYTCLAVCSPMRGCFCEGGKTDLQGN